MRVLLFALICSVFGFTSCENEEEETGIDPFLEELIVLVNEVRSEGCNCGDAYYPAVGTLEWNELLINAAQLHANDMGVNDFFSHTGSDGSSAGDRITAQGYSWSAYGENIARGQDSPEDVMQSWLNSTGHCANIMNENFTEIGVGYYAEGNYWVQVFAKPQ
jgi:uncharacterized protein YkwD